MIGTLSYLARRWPERSTRFICLPLILLALLLGIAAWHWRDDMRWAAGALIAGIISGALPDRIFNVLDHSLKAWRSLREAIPRFTLAAKPDVGGVALQKESTRMSFETLKDDIAAAKGAAMKDAEALIAAAQTEAGKKVIADAIAALPEVDQPIAQALQSLTTDPSIENFATVLEDVYARFNAVKNAPVNPA